MSVCTYTRYAASSTVQVSRTCCRDVKTNPSIMREHTQTLDHGGVQRVVRRYPTHRLYLHACVRVITVADPANVSRMCGYADV